VTHNLYNHWSKSKFGKVCACNILERESTRQMAPLVLDAILSLILINTQKKRVSWGRPKILYLQGAVQATDNIQCVEPLADQKVQRLPAHHH
jgi:hypothetical protein